MPMPRVVPERKACEYCGAQFEVGGRGRPPRKTRFCSKACKAFTRIILPDLKQMSVRDKLYVAGVFDGEGSIILWDRGYGGRPQLRCTISNTHEPLMAYLQQSTGSGSVVKKVYPIETGYKDAFTWQVYGSNAVSFLKQLLPYLIVKRDRAVEAIDSQKVKNHGKRNHST